MQNPRRDIIAPMNRRGLTICLVFGALVSFGSAQETPSTANDLLVSCEKSPANPTCLWYLKGFIDGVGANPGSVRIQTACFPTQFTLDEIRRVVVKSLVDHPERLHLPVARSVQDALKNAFPCKK
jgi:Rap1a immunity proteins